MSNADSHLALNDRNLALAIVLALQMWSHDRYQRFLCGRNSDLDAEWFQWFVGEWKVARTIQKGKLDEVRRYLDQDFRRAATKDASGMAIDVASSHIKASEWSAKLGKKKVPNLPISLVSKVGFFLRPSDFVPFDGFSLIGLNRIYRTIGTPKLKAPTYPQYLSAFNEQFATIAAQISASLNESWVSALAAKLGCPDGALKTGSLLRKVFDHYLMYSGGYLSNQPKQSSL